MPQRIGLQWRSIEPWHRLVGLAGGVLADTWFEPAMRPDGSLVELFGSLVGGGLGAGMALMFAITAVLGAAMSVSGYLFSAVRNIELDLPDYGHEVLMVRATQAD